jgi:two-component system NtrC family sensor kinase
MKLARRLSFAISLGILLVLGINAWVRVDQERQDYRADARLDHAAFGRGLAAAIEFVWERDGADVALEAVEQFNQRESHLTIRWVWPNPGAGEEEYAPRSSALVPQTGEKTRSEVVSGEGGIPHMLTYAPIDVPGGRGGALELYESLANEKLALRTILWRAVVTLALLVALCVGLTFGFGFLLVAAPLRALVAKAERIGAGDLSGPLQLAKGSEIRELAVAMNAMCERLSEARARVEQEALARIRAIEQLRHADRLRTVGELASGIAHQLGTPLNVVRVRGSMIASGEVTERRMRELGAVIVEHVDRASETIRQLLNFARREEANFAAGDLARTLQETISLVEPLAIERRVAVTNKTTLRGAPITMDARQIHQALTNILMNAIHATPEGGEVCTSVREQASGFVIEIQDAGEGIGEEHLPHIFEPFYTTKRAGDGTGLGLSVADGIVRRHGGAIEVETSTQGTLFRVWLPHDGAARTDPAP